MEASVAEDRGLAPVESNSQEGPAPEEAEAATGEIGKVEEMEATVGIEKAEEVDKVGEVDNLPRVDEES